MKKVIEEIDPSLEFISPYMGSHREAVVARKGRAGLFAIKYISSSHRPSKQRMDREIEALQTAGKIPGINPLVEVYDQKRYQALLRKILGGRTTLEAARVSLNTLQQKKLENTVRELHNKGIVDLGIHRGNIVVSLSEEEEKIISVGKARIANSYSWATKEHYSLEKFEGMKSTDKKGLKRLT